MTQKMYFTVEGVRVQQMFSDWGVGFTLPQFKKLLDEVEVRGDYSEQEYGNEVSIPITTLIRYIEGASVEVVGGSEKGV